MKPFDVFEKFPIHITAGKGCYVYDEQGASYLDLYGGHAVISIGHGHPTFLRRLSEQMEKLVFYSNAVENKLQEQLAAQLGMVAGYPDYQVFFSNSGAEANENAIKLASFHTGRKKVLAFSKAFHGRTSAAVAATDYGALRAPINESDHFVFSPFNDIGSMQKQLETNVYAGVIIEGIQGVGGIHVPDDIFLQELQKSCEKTGTMLILDEIQSGYGRTGKFFAHQHSSIKPDLITVAKGIGNGFPMAATLISPKFNAKKGQLGTTFGGGSLACSAGLAVLEVLVQEDLINNAGKVGNYLMTELAKLPEVMEVRGRGLMIGLTFEEPIAALRENLLFTEKVFTGASGAYTMRLLPPLCLSMEQADSFLGKLKKQLLSRQKHSQAIPAAVEV